eukprot:CAMPEP_0170551844 /NCGR_PEP_ID=MMETSP0211-20121228/9847_1 /TAXON_ID=311385 /ORGANISM="Pseudokeronopsis sp., Strain OXSARD2" /LENGTH=64 /DNA_ID=CAMNT_0010859271 /DNA_START=258 /DNA_END=452 /DNA_ORIENTATION=-
MSTVLKDQVSKECEQLIFYSHEREGISKKRLEADQLGSRDQSLKDKHEQKRANLKKKRAREQLM